MNTKDTSAAAIFVAIEARDLDALTHLIAAGGDVNATNEDGDSLLIFAARVRAYDLVECLLAHGADVHAKDMWGYTLLEYAYSAESPRLVKLALTHGASVDAKALDVAWLLLAQTENVALMQNLLAQGANPAVTMPNGFLCKLGALTVHPLHTFDRLADVLKTDAHDADSLVGFNALMLAAEYGCQNMADWLVTLPLDVNHRSQNGSTALICAAYDDALTSVVKKLLEKGANPNAMDDSGWAALFASLKNNAPINAGLLLAAGADALYKDAEGYTTLMAAARGGCLDLIPTLIASGVAPNAQSDGETALDIALAEKHTEIAELITAAGGVCTSNKPIDEAKNSEIPPEGYFDDLVEQLKLCIPDLAVDALLSIAPPTSFKDDYGYNTSVLYWLSDGLEAQGLLEYQEWKEYWGDLPALSPLRDLSLAYDAQPILDALDDPLADDYSLPWDLPYLELMNHHLKPHGLQIITFACENLYMICLRDDAQQIDKLDKLLSVAGIQVITPAPMDLKACLDSMQ